MHAAFISAVPVTESMVAEHRVVEDDVDSRFKIFLLEFQDAENKHNRAFKAFKEEWAFLPSSIPVPPYAYIPLYSSIRTPVLLGSASEKPPCKLRVLCRSCWNQLQRVNGSLRNSKAFKINA